MAYTLSISSWRNQYIQETIEDLGNSPSALHLKCLDSILEGYRNCLYINTYSNYCPWMNLDCTPQNREIIGQVLYWIWEQCQCEMIPELNFMVVRKNTGLPGKAILGDWLEKYGNKDGFEIYCKLRAKESKFFLEKGLVKIVD